MHKRVLLYSEPASQREDAQSFSRSAYDLFGFQADPILALFEVEPDVIAFGNFNHTSQILAIVNAASFLPNNPIIATTRDTFSWRNKLTPYWQNRTFMARTISGAYPQIDDDRSKNGAPAARLTDILLAAKPAMDVVAFLQRVQKILNVEAGLFVKRSGGQLTWRTISSKVENQASGESAAFEFADITHAGQLRKIVPAELKAHLSEDPLWVSPVVQVGKDLLWIPCDDAGHNLSLKECKLVENVATRLSYRDFETTTFSESSLLETSGENEELVKKLEMLTLAFDSSPDPIIAADRDGKIMLFNPAARQYLGWKPSDVSDAILSVRDIYPAGYAQEIFRLMMQDLQAGHDGQISEHECRLAHRSGRQIPVSLNASLLLNENRHPIASIGIFKDLSTLKKAQAAARIHQPADSQAQASRDAIVRGIAGATSHLLNQPLQAIMTTLEIEKKKIEKGILNPTLESTEQLLDKLLAHCMVQKEQLSKLSNTAHYETESYADRDQIAVVGQREDTE